MKITVIAVGKIKEKYLKEGINEYVKRLSRFCNLELLEVSDEQAPDNIGIMQELQIKKKEGERILRKVKEGSCLVVLDVKGEKPDSEELSNRLNSFFISGKSHITFVIGGSLGVDSEVLKAADLKLSLSNLTYPHQLARLILLEQLYRSFKIINGETYHK
ncbi:MAG: 23S rRNA (pseudouridine(1915)-N(3))-methyltransferase RlmH [Clostridiaceae bacterium]|nr:23S rRNA (pseudouridine(1915)-N(3))-methyltransferase RlmH [Clostridiaceae bacterium]